MCACPTALAKLNLADVAKGNTELQRALEHIEAADLALWNAAQILLRYAKGRGWDITGLKVTKRHSSLIESKILTKQQNVTQL